MNLKEAWNFGLKALQDDAEAECLCTLLLCHVLQKDRLYLHLHGEEALSEEKEKAFREGLSRLSRGEPLQYITGEQDFMGLTFMVKAGVLIPRQDTETLVEAVLSRLSKESPLKILDIGTGSGAISVSLAHYLPLSEVTGADISPEALCIALENAKKNRVDGRMRFIEADIMKEFPSAAGGWDAIVSNPPYIEAEVYETLEKRVHDYEPKAALTDDGDGLSFYRRISEEAMKHLKSKGLLAFEIGYRQGEAVSGMLQEKGYHAVEVLKDLGGRDRVVLGRKEF